MTTDVRLSYTLSQFENGEVWSVLYCSLMRLFMMLLRALGYRLFTKVHKEDTLSLLGICPNQFNGFLIMNAHCSKVFMGWRNIQTNSSYFCLCDNSYYLFNKGEIILNVPFQHTSFFQYVFCMTWDSIEAGLQWRRQCPEADFTFSTLV